MGRILKNCDVGVHIEADLRDNGNNSKRIR
jgi:hypothetical protein